VGNHPGGLDRRIRGGRAITLRRSAALRTGADWPDASSRARSQSDFEVAETLPECDGVAVISSAYKENPDAESGFGDGDGESGGDCGDGARDSGGESVVGIVSLFFFSVFGEFCFPNLFPFLLY